MLPTPSLLSLPPSLGGLTAAQSSWKFKQTDQYGQNGELSICKLPSPSWIFKELNQKQGEDRIQVFIFPSGKIKRQKHLCRSWLLGYKTSQVKLKGNNSHPASLFSKSAADCKQRPLKRSAHLLQLRDVLVLPDFLPFSEPTLPLPMLLPLNKTGSPHLSTWKAGQSSDSGCSTGIRLLRFQPCLSYLLTAWAWVSYLIFLCLCFCLNEMRVLIALPLYSHWKDSPPWCRLTYFTQNWPHLKAP